MERASLEQWQSERLAHLVERLYNRVPFYKRKMDAAGVKPKDVTSIKEIGRLPFTDKSELREVYPYGLLATDLDNIVEIHTSSGTTGKAVVDAYTQGDIDIWSEVMARTLSMGGTTHRDIVQNAFGYGLFTGGLGVHYGSRRIGAAVIPISGGNTKRQLAVMADFKSTILTCTPSYSLLLAEIAREQGMDFTHMSLKAGFFGAEAWSESMRKEIEKKLHLKAYDIYGLTEIIGPGVSSECEHQHGLHINEDHFYPEIINAQTGEPLQPGEKGELVVTTITKQGTPLLRYRTRDLTCFLDAPCPCKRTLRRMHRLFGRTDDMLIIRGVNVFPSQIEEVLLKLEGIEPQYQLVVERKENLDCLEVQVEMNEKTFSDEIKNLENFEQTIEHELYSALGIHTRVKLVEPKTIERSEGKAKRIIDKRHM
jgi:phenylacetate-CoA ligase